MSKYNFPGASSLPAIDGLPDPFLKPDGTRVQSPAEWLEQREYLKEMLAHYMYGHMPPAPGNVKGEITASAITNDGLAVSESVHITCGPDMAIGFDVSIVRPNKSGRFPAFIWNRKLESSCPVEREAIERGYIIAVFEKNQLANDGSDYADGPCGRAYPEYDWRALAMWAWGQSRVADYLLTTDYTDGDKLIATGHSRHGKASLCAAIYDERFAAAALAGSGCGGTGNFRHLGGRMGEGIGRCERLEDMSSKKSFWYWTSDNVYGFEGENIKKLPFDSHFARALMAPRPVISVEGLDDTWVNEFGTMVTWIASQEVYDFLGASDKNALNFREREHEYCAQDWMSVLSFCDNTLLGKKSPPDYKLYSREIDPPASMFCRWAKED